MDFTIILQRNNSDRIALDKNITNVVTISGNLRTETSIIDPVIIVEGNEANIFTCNYMTVEAFGRSYFINDIRSVGKRLIEISAHVDVLTTYKAAIRANRGITKRQENNWNTYLNDGLFKVYQNPHVITQHFKKNEADFRFSGECFVLGVAGRGREVTPT